MAELAPPKPHNFAERLKQASKALGAPVDELVSIKIRPIKDVGGFETEYLGNRDYDEINKALKDVGLRITDVDLGYGGIARLCELAGGQTCLYLEHESGPEVILHLLTMSAAAAGSSFFAVNQAIKLINALARFTRQKPRRNGKGRFIATSIEKRAAKGLKVIRQIERVAKATERAIKNVEELFK